MATDAFTEIDVDAPAVHAYAGCAVYGDNVYFTPSKSTSCLGMAGDEEMAFMVIPTHRFVADPGGSDRNYGTPA